MSKKTVSVSIVAANYNNGKYLHDFIGSVSDSTVLPQELIIIDDGSTDNSLELLREFSDLDFLKLIKFEKNRGFCEALNAGIELASGKYIMRIDPDDILLAERLQTQFEFLENNKEIDVVGSNVIYFLDDTNEDISTSNFPTEHADIYKVYQKGEHGIQHPSAMIRADVMKQFRYIQENFKSEDYDIFARMISNGYKFVNISEPLTRMRVHSGSISINIKYGTIKHTYDLRDQIFKKRTNPLKIRLYYWHILNYKKYLISKNSIKKIFYMGLASVFYPRKAFSKILNLSNK